ncbi:MAG: hypothetical protein U0V70_08205 [Terriglobia bacterium]
MKKWQWVVRILILFFLILELSGTGLTQQTQKGGNRVQEESDVFIAAPATAVAVPAPGAEGNVVVGGAMGPGVGMFHMAVGDVGLDLPSKPVKGAPYSAEATTETVQTLADGNRIIQKNSSMVYRDSEGRSRREHTVGPLLPLAGGDEPPQLIFINDPVAGVSYILNLKDHIASKIVLHQSTKSASNVMWTSSGAVRGSKMATFEKKVTAAPGEPEGPIFVESFRSELDVKPETESLGKRVIEGLETEGTRSTITIPAGQIGNEQPIQIVSERWFSPELGTVILSKHSDPRFAETTYRLTGISRSEPVRSLFEVPSDFTIKDGGPPIPGIGYRKVTPKE